eukprot:5476743-Alexandrium_andersonii.AAC.1
MGSMALLRERKRLGMDRGAECGGKSTRHRKEGRPMFSKPEPDSRSLNGHCPATRNGTRSLNRPGWWCHTIWNRCLSYSLCDTPWRANKCEQGRMAAPHDAEPWPVLPTWVFSQAAAIQKQSSARHRHSTSAVGEICFRSSLASASRPAALKVGADISLICVLLKGSQHRCRKTLMTPRS